MKRRLSALLLALVLSATVLCGCQPEKQEPLPPQNEQTQQQPQGSQKPKVPENQTVQQDEDTQPEEELSAQPESSGSFLLSDVPEYSGLAYIGVNQNQPFFTADELTDESYEYYSPLDGLGRCGVAVASVGRDLMPTEERGAIGMIKPSGWHTVKYDCVDGKYLYNRCHLIGFQLTGENANESNLITGTRYLNIEGMLPFENMVADYVKETSNHVLYRVTPIFEENNLVAAGVLMEGYSVEDKGAGVCYCVFAYNVQPGVTIDYATGESQSAPTESATDPMYQSDKTPNAEGSYNYIVNANTGKFHYPDCPSVGKMKESNKIYSNATREELISQGYSPCGRCHP